MKHPMPWPWEPYAPVRDDHQHLAEGWLSGQPGCQGARCNIPLAPCPAGVCLSPRNGTGGPLTRPVAGHGCWWAMKVGAFWARESNARPGTPESTAPACSTQLHLRQHFHQRSPHVMDCGSREALCMGSRGDAGAVHGPRGSAFALDAGRASRGRQWTYGVRRMPGRGEAAAQARLGRGVASSTTTMSGPGAQSPVRIPFPGYAGTIVCIGSSGSWTRRALP